MVVVDGSVVVVVAGAAQRSKMPEATACDSFPSSSIAVTVTAMTALVALSLAGNALANGPTVLE